MFDDRNMSSQDPDVRLDSAPVSSQGEAPGIISARIDGADEPWTLRPWLMAGICTVAGLLFHLFTQDQRGASSPSLNFGLAALVAVSSLSFVLGVERRRWQWAALFSAFWGLVIGLIAWRMAHYASSGDLWGWPLLSGILAVLIATPFFQTRRDVAANGRQWRLWQLPYARLHDHAWTDAVIGAAALIFSGISLLLMLLIGGMFGLIDIDVISDLLEESWFRWMLAGASFGGAVGLLRERDRLVSVMQRLVMVVLSILVPVLAVAVALFLISLIGTGLAPLWESGFSASILLLLTAAASVLLANAVLGNRLAERSGNRLLHMGAVVLTVAVLPMSAIAASAMALRVGQYGWTPERLWGAIAVVVALSYGLAGCWAALQGYRARAARADGFAEILRPLQQKLAIGVMVLAALLALPIADFGAISAHDQVARLKSGRVSAEDFDWRAMAFQYGPAGRRSLEGLAASGHQEWTKLAKTALASKDSWGASADIQAAIAVPIEQRLRVMPDGASLPQDARTILQEGQCQSAYMCVVYVMGPQHIILISQRRPNHYPDQTELMKSADGKWKNPPFYPSARMIPDLKTADVVLETKERRRLIVGDMAQDWLN